MAGVEVVGGPWEHDCTLPTPFHPPSLQQHNTCNTTQHPQFFPQSFILRLTPKLETKTIANWVQPPGSTGKHRRLLQAPVAPAVVVQNVTGRLVIDLNMAPGTGGPMASRLMVNAAV